jgi:SAM-dependent methyltransferase
MRVARKRAWLANVHPWPRRIRIGGFDVDWKAKVAVQFCLAHVPGGERLNYALQTLRKSRSRAKTRARVIKLAEMIALVRRYVELDGASVVEAGTGWDAINAIMLALLGAKTVYTFDHVWHVRHAEVAKVIEAIQDSLDEIAVASSLPITTLRERVGLMASASSLDRLFQSTGIAYMAPGDAAHTALPDASVDLFYSYAVLEHVPDEVVGALTEESRRVLKRDGVAFHAIGEHDHYVDFDGSISKVNFLQYPEWAWKLFVKNGISYHNRMREKQFLDLFASYGAHVKFLRSFVDDRDLDALKTMKVDRRFSGMSARELAINRTEVIFGFESEVGSDRIAATPARDHAHAATAR